MNDAELNRLVAATAPITEARVAEVLGVADRALLVTLLRAVVEPLAAFPPARAARVAPPPLPRRTQAGHGGHNLPRGK